MKRDGHIHTPFCPHGSNDRFEQYIEKAISSGFQEISFTEHAPLPNGFNDPTPQQDSGMDLIQLDPYISTITELKKEYASFIQINVGLEVDFIEGFELETTKFLNKYGPYLDDSILSVHFLKYQEEYTCIDYSKEVYLDFAEKVGSVKNMYHLYYETVLLSIKTDLGLYKPKRIGHPTLVHKFQLAHGLQIEDASSVHQVLDAMKQGGYELDLNSAGLSKAYCLQTYPPLAYLPYIKDIKLPFVFGSDAHVVVDLHQHYDKVIE